MSVYHHRFFGVIARVKYCINSTVPRNIVLKPLKPLSRLLRQTRASVKYNNSMFELKIYYINTQMCYVHRYYIMQNENRTCACRSMPMLQDTYFPARLSNLLSFSIIVPDFRLFCFVVDFLFVLHFITIICNNIFFCVFV